MASEMDRTLSMNVMMVVMMMISGTSVLASSPQKAHTKPSNDSSGHGGTHQEKVFPVLDFDYDHVHYPFVIFLWILLASLMKLGEGIVSVCFIA